MLPSLRWLTYVFSTYVEVILTRDPERIEELSILHVCGGDPQLPKKHNTEIKYSPRMWR